MTGASHGHLAVGQQLGRYLLVRELGRGSMGLVFLAHDSRLSESVCLKVMNPVLMMNPEAVERFSREIVLARRVQHPGVCRVFELHEEQGVRFLSMEHIEGICLRDLLGADRPLLSVERVASLVAGVCEALQAAHDVGVVHRDLKPRNIMVRPDGSPVLLDFGIATAMDVGSNLTLPGVALGTKHYIAPEVWAGKPASPRSDQYAVGVILFNCLTGKMPFRAAKEMLLLQEMRKGPPPPPSALRTGINKAIDDVTLKALSFSPDDRFKDMRAFGDALVAAAGGRAALLRPTDKIALDAAPTVPVARPSALGAGPDPVTTPMIGGAAHAAAAAGFVDPYEKTAVISVDEADPLVRTHPSFPPITLPSVPPNSAGSGGGLARNDTVVLMGPGVNEPTLDEPRPPMRGGPPPAAPQTQVLTERMPRAHGDGPAKANPGETAEQPLVVEGMLSARARLAVAFALGAVVVTIVAVLLWPTSPPVVGPPLVAPPVVAPPVVAPPVVAPPVVAPPVVAPPVVAPPVAAPPVVAPPEPPAVEVEPAAAPRDSRRPAAGAAARASRRAAAGDKREWLEVRGAVDALAKEKGIISGDDTEVDRLRGHAAALAGQGKWDDAVADLGDARDRLDALVVDRSFVKSKLVRFNARFDEVTDDAARSRADATAQRAMTALTAGRLAEANRALNEGFAALR